MQANSIPLKERFRAYFGLSRMHHSLLDIANPSVGALAALGGFPPALPLLVGLVSAFAGVTAVFGINDVMDRRVDTEKMAKYRRKTLQFDLDALGCRHPLAQGKMSLVRGLGWVVFWALLSLFLAFVLNPLCCLMMLIAAGMEICYCKLLKRTHWKALLSGGMVGIGTLAGIYAYMNSPSVNYILTFFIWTFSWEVGGRNITGDWADLEEDAHLGIRTFPVRYGRLRSSRIAFALMLLTVLSSLSFPFVGLIKSHSLYYAGALMAGGFFLLLPGMRWLRSQDMESAMVVFNRACFYPLAMFVVVTLSTLNLG